MEDNSPLLEAPEKTGTGEGENASTGPATYSGSSVGRFDQLPGFQVQGDDGLQKKYLANNMALILFRVKRSSGIIHSESHYKRPLQLIW